MHLTCSLYNTEVRRSHWIHPPEHSSYTCAYPWGCCELKPLPSRHWPAGRIGRRHSVWTSLSQINGPHSKLECKRHFYYQPSPSLSKNTQPCKQERQHSSSDLWTDTSEWDAAIKGFHFPTAVDVCTDAGKSLYHRLQHSPTDPAQSCGISVTQTTVEHTTIRSQSTSQQVGL